MEKGGVSAAQAAAEPRPAIGSPAPPHRALTCRGSVAAVPPGPFRGSCQSDAAADGSLGGRPLHRLAAVCSRHRATVRAAAQLQPGAAMLSCVVGGARTLTPPGACARDPTKADSPPS